MIFITMIFIKVYNCISSTNIVVLFSKVYVVKPINVSACYMSLFIRHILLIDASVSEYVDIM